MCVKKLMHTPSVMLFTFTGDVPNSSFSLYSSDQSVCDVMFYWRIHWRCQIFPESRLAQAYLKFAGTKLCFVISNDRKSWKVHLFTYHKFVSVSFNLHQFLCPCIERSRGILFYHCPSVQPSVHLSVHPTVRLSLCPTVCLQKLNVKT